MNDSREFWDETLDPDKADSPEGRENVETAREIVSLLGIDQPPPSFWRWAALVLVFSIPMTGIVFVVVGMTQLLAYAVSWAVSCIPWWIYTPGLLCVLWCWLGMRSAPR